MKNDFLCPVCKRDNFSRAMLHTFWTRNSFSKTWPTWDCPNCKTKLRVEGKGRRKVFSITLGILIAFLFLAVPAADKIGFISPFSFIAISWILGGTLSLTVLAKIFAAVEAMPLIP